MIHFVMGVGKRTLQITAILVLAAGCSREGRFVVTATGESCGFGAWISGKCQWETEGVAEAQRSRLPPFVTDFLINGQRAFEAGAYDLALAYTDSVEFYAPALADLHFLRGAIYTRLNRPDIARVAYEVVLDIDPHYAGARHNMALIAFRAGQLRNAIDLYREEEEKVGPSPALYHELGRAYAKLGEPDSAQWSYESAIALDSTYATSYMWLGQLMEESGNLDDALQMSLKGLSFRPDDLDYQYIVGTQYRRLELPEEAVPFLEPVAAAQPWHQGAQTNLGQVYMQLGREAEAREYFARAETAQQQAQEILEAEEAINTDPDMLDNWLHLANLLRQSGQNGRAIEALKNAASRDMPPGIWMGIQNNLAFLYLQDARPQEAAELFEMIVLNDSTSAAAWVGLGASYASLELLQEARFALQKALDIDPRNEIALNNLIELDKIQSESE